MKSHFLIVFLCSRSPLEDLVVHFLFLPKFPFSFYCASYQTFLNYHGQLTFSKNVIKNTVGKPLPLWVILEV
jgi:hypothetical protein